MSCYHLKHNMNRWELTLSAQKVHSWSQPIILQQKHIMHKASHLKTERNFIGLFRQHGSLLCQGWDTRTREF